MVRMRASWSSAYWAEIVGGESMCTGCVVVVGGVGKVAFGGSGGRGIAGGGDGRETAETDLCLFEVRELERSWVYCTSWVRREFCFVISTVPLDNMKDDQPTSAASNRVQTSASSSSNRTFAMLASNKA